MTNKSLLTAWLLILISAGSGCTMFTKEKGAKKDSPWESMKWWKKEYQTPTKMAVLWSPDLLTVAGKPPTRGFGGRIYFYNEKSQTIPVEGELVVHGFDESRKKATGGDQSLPDKRFRFTAEQFTEHFSESEIGASYSVWIPWDCNDFSQKEITLIPTFVSKTGQMVQGAAAKAIIPGHAQGQSVPPGTNAPLPIQTVAYEQATVPTVEGKLPTLSLPVRDVEKLRGQEASDMKVTTIKIPGSLNRNARSQANSQANQAGNVPMNNAQSNVPNNSMQPTGVAPYVNAQLEQMRAQAVADAFRPLEQVQPAPNAGPYVPPPNSSWTPMDVPSASMRATNLNSIKPPNASQTNPVPNMQPMFKPMFKPMLSLHRNTIR